MLFAVEEYEALHGGSTQADDASFQHRHITNQGFNSKHAKYKLPSGSGSDQLVDGHTRNLHSLRTHLASTGAHPTGSLRFRASWEDVMWYRPGLF
jgi:hypothetical protein